MVVMVVGVVEGDPVASWNPELYSGFPQAGNIAL